MHKDDDMACSSLLRLMILPFAFAVLVASSVAHGAVVEHTFNVGNLSISQLCQPARIITAVNGQLPGPTIHVREVDTVVVHLLNTSPRFHCRIAARGIKLTRVCAFMSSPLL